jgi:hypothetical protein
MARSFVLEDNQGNWPHFVALIEGKVVGCCDITSLHRNAVRIETKYEIQISMALLYE